MDDLFRSLDVLDAPDLRDDVARRMDVPPLPIPEPPRRARSVTTALVAFAVFLAGTSIAFEAFRHEPHQSMSHAWSAYGEGWTTLPGPPRDLEGSSWLWAGDRLIAWGGCENATGGGCHPSSTGYSFDPTSSSWTSIPDSPVAGRAQASVWTGTEVLFFGATQTTSLAFSPTDGLWRTLSSSPFAPSDVLTVTWTGTEAVLFDRGTGEVAGYDPATDAWSKLPAEPEALNSGDAVWTGREIILIGASLNSGNHASTPTAIGEAYDPATDAWRLLPPSELSPQAVAASWIDDRLVAWDYTLRSQEYDPASDTWSAPARVPLEASECYNDAAVVSDVVFGWYCGEAALYDPAQHAWQQEGGGPLDQTVYSKAYQRAIHVWRFADLVPSGDVLVLRLTGLTLDDKGVACYGCAGSPTSFWVFRPPSSPTSASRVQLPITSVDVGATVRSVTTAAGSVWAVTQPTTGGPTLVRLDPQGQVVARISLGLDSVGSDIAAGATSVWVVGTRGGQHGVVQIDAQSNAVSRWIPNVFGPLAAIGNGVWGTASGAADELDLVRPDESTGDITARVVGKGSPFEIVPAGSSVWVLPSHGQRVVEVDATTGSIQAEVTVALAGTWATWDGSRLWLSAWPPPGAEPPSSGGSGSGYIDPNSGLFVSVGSIYNFRPFAAADGLVWFIAGPHDGSLHGACALDPTTGKVSACADITGPELDGRDRSAPMSRRETHSGSRHPAPRSTACRCPGKQDQRQIRSGDQDAVASVEKTIHRRLL